MSRLRAKCPDCKTNTAVAIGPEYECHACGRTFGAGLVRVPRAAVVAAESRIAAQISVMTAIGADRLAARDGR